MKTLSSAFVIALTSLSATSQTPAGDNWPQWRGPGGLGVASENDFAMEWSPTTNI